MVCALAVRENAWPCTNHDENVIMFFVDSKVWLRRVTAGTPGICTRHSRSTARSTCKATSRTGRYLDGRAQRYCPRLYSSLSCPLKNAVNCFLTICTENRRRARPIDRRLHPGWLLKQTQYGKNDGCSRCNRNNRTCHLNAI